jgi:16S rRNA (cytosine1402-N4)-methyltransferase
MFYFAVMSIPAAIRGFRLNMKPDSKFHHIPVLVNELIEALQIREGGCYLDCTVGGGGHSDRILQVASTVKVIALDRDEMAITAAREKLSVYGDRVQFWHGTFSDYQLPAGLRFDGILADLGVSSAQFDLAERGFSFRDEGALDMRMDQQQLQTAADLVNETEESALADIFFQLGEERFSRRIARQIVEMRPFETTTQLAEAIARCVPKSYRYGRIHPATRVFQALRIAVNQELEHLQAWLQRAPDWLVAGGRIAVISFHSLEDRPIKYAFRQDDRLKVITKKPIVPSDTEIAANPRSRSAKLRVAERLACSEL